MNRQRSCYTILLHFILCFLVVVCSVLGQQKERTLGIAAYLPDYRTGYNVNASASHLTDLILFSIQPHRSGMIAGVCCLQPSHFELFGRAFREQHNPDLHVWVTIGGAGRADAIPSISADPAKRKRLIDGIVRLSRTHDLYGIDLDIYYPTTHQELSDYQRFVQEAAVAWHEEGLAISVTWHPQRMKLPPDVFELVDRVNLMAYDMMTTTGSAYHSSMVDTQRSVESILKQQKCPPEKVWLGIPFYGRSIQNPGHAETFEALYKGMVSDTMTTKDFDVDESFRHNGFEWDSPKRIRTKVNYAYAKKLGGVFFWELGQDYQDESTAPGGILLEAASNRRGELLAIKQNDEL